MRDFKSMKRQRSRGRGGGGGGGGGGGKPGQNVNRAFDSNGPDGVKIRGHAQHVFEKYQQLARDAASSGDRVLAENYLQHAEHYFRLIRAVQPQRPASEIIGRDAFASGIDIDFEDETGAYAEGEAGDVPAEESGEAREPRAEQRQDQPRGDSGRGDYRSEGRGDYRQDRRPDYRRDEQRQEGRQDRYEGRRDDRGERPAYRDDRRDRYEQPRGERAEAADPLAVVEPEATPLTASRAPEEASPSLRSQDGGFSPAPAFLQSRVEAPAAEAEDAAEQPRRRRGRPRRSETAEVAETADEG